MIFPLWVNVEGRSVGEVLYMLFLKTEFAGGSPSKFSPPFINTLKEPACSKSNKLLTTLKELEPLEKDLRS